MIPVLSSIVLASIIADDQIIVGCSIGDDELISPCIADDQFNTFGGLGSCTLPAEIYVLHDNMYLMGNKTLEISHVINNMITFSSTTSTCNATLTMPNGTIWQIATLYNNSDGVNNNTVNFNNTISGAWIADYECQYNFHCDLTNSTASINTELQDGFYVTSYGGILAYIDTKTFELLNGDLNLMFGLLFLFIGIIFLYSIYKYRTRNKLKIGGSFK